MAMGRCGALVEKKKSRDTWFTAQVASMQKGDEKRARNFSRDKKREWPREKEEKKIGNKTDYISIASAGSR